MNPKKRFQDLTKQADEIWKMLAAHEYINEQGKVELLMRAQEIMQEMNKLAQEIEADGGNPT